MLPVSMNKYCIAPLVNTKAELMPSPLFVKEFLSSSPLMEESLRSIGQNK